jgi:hypothetical protein
VPCPRRPITAPNLGHGWVCPPPGHVWVSPLGAVFLASLSGRTETDPRCPFGSTRWRCPYTRYHILALRCLHYVVSVLSYLLILIFYFGVESWSEWYDFNRCR